jgi:hypothetical protein
VNNLALKCFPGFPFRLLVLILIFFLYKIYELTSLFMFKNLQELFNFLISIFLIVV